MTFVRICLKSFVATPPVACTTALASASLTPALNLTRSGTSETELAFAPSVAPAAGRPASASSARLSRDRIAPSAAARRSRDDASRDVRAPALNEPAVNPNPTQSQRSSAPRSSRANLRVPERMRKYGKAVEERRDTQK